LRLVLHLIKQEIATTRQLSEALMKMREEIKYCKTCHNISDQEICSICKSHRRDSSIVCVVEDARDVMAIENTGQYQGTYHVLGGVVSPVEGIGPDSLQIESLLNRIRSEEPKVREIIFALSPTMEGDTTSFYITKKINNLPVKITSIARGIPLGGQLEYTDEITLGRSIVARTDYQQD